MYVESSGRWHEQRSRGAKWGRTDGQTLSPLTTDVRFNAAKTFQTPHSPYLWSQAATPRPVPASASQLKPCCPSLLGEKIVVWKVKFECGRKGAGGGRGTADFFLWRRKRVVPWPNLRLPLLPSRAVGHVGRSGRNLRGFMWMRAVISRTTWKKLLLYQTSSVTGIFYILATLYKIVSYSQNLVLWTELYLTIFVSLCFF